MAARLWRNEEECVEAIERSLKGIEVIQNQCRIDMLDPSVADAIGRSLYQHFSNFCEGVLYIICSMKATIDGTRDFPKLKDLLTQGDLVNATPEAKLASNGISGLKKSFDNGPISLDMIRLLLHAVNNFMDWAWTELRNPEDYILDSYGVLMDIEQRYRSIMRRFEDVLSDRYH